MTTINKMSLEIPALSVNESFARATLCAFAAQLDPTMDEIDDIKTAVSEAVTNAVVHAECETIRIDAELFPSSIRIIVTDTGKGIRDINRAMEPFVTTKADAERSGMGFTVMSSFMDKLDVQSKPGQGTTITMQKRFARRKEA